MKKLDIIPILGSGVDEIDFCISKISELGTKNSRLIYLFPKEKSWKDTSRVYSIKRNSNINVHPHMPAASLTEISKEDFNRYPSLRFLDDPEEGNVALLVDDYYSSSKTIRSSINDLIELGYNKDEIFFYIGLSKKCDKWGYYGNDLKESSWQEIFELIKS